MTEDRRQLCVVLFLTGVPPAEESLRARGDADRRYPAQTTVLVP